MNGVLSRRMRTTRGSSSKNDRLDFASKLLPILAVLGTTCFGVFEYFDFRHEAAHVELAKAHVELDKAHVDLDRQAAETRQADISLKMLELDRQLKGIEVKAASQAPLEQTYDLSVQPLLHGSAALLQATLHIRVKNASKNALSLPSGRLSLFIGTLASLPVQGAAVRLNPPSYEGPIVWRKVDDKQYVSLGDNLLAWVKSGLHIADTGGLAYGRLQTGETMDLDNVFLINASGDSWFGYTTSFMVQQEKEKPFAYDYSSFVQIRRAKDQRVTGGGSPSPTSQAESVKHAPG